MSEFVQPIQKAVTWYASKGKSAPLDLLVEARAKLSCHLFGLSGEVGEAYTGKVGSEFRRKKKFNERLIAYMNGENRMSATAAAVPADADVAQERQDEAEWDAMYRGLWLLYDSTKEVLAAMSQQIASMKQEKGLDIRNMGGQSVTP